MKPGDEGALELRLLGPLEVVARGETVVLGGGKPRALLAVLALELGGQSRRPPHRLALAVRGPGDRGARGQGLRLPAPEGLPEAVIATRPTGYALELGPDRVDATVFRRAGGRGARALVGRRRPRAGALLPPRARAVARAALADFRYEPFAQADIARLDELRAAALEARVDADLAAGLHRELVGELWSEMDIHPLRERTWAQLMGALPLRTREPTRSPPTRGANVLVDRLGVEPGHELRSLEAAILRQDDSLLSRRRRRRCERGGS